MKMHNTVKTASRRPGPGLELPEQRGPVIRRTHNHLSVPVRRWSHGHAVDYCLMALVFPDQSARTDIPRLERRVGRGGRDEVEGW